MNKRTVLEFLAVGALVVFLTALPAHPLKHKTPTI